MNKTGIDVSVYQGNIDWERVKATGIDFAIIRCGYGSDIAKQDDSKFKRNADECTRLGIPFGVYLYSYANTIEKAVSEAEHVLRLIKGYKLSYPVFYDLEDANTTQKCSAKAIADIAEKFCEIICNAGFYFAVYANKYWFESVLTDKRFCTWDRWVAQYNDKLTYEKEHTMWQYTSQGRVDGIEGKVDMNYCYVDYPAKISGNIAPEQPDEPAQDTDEVYIVKSGDTLSEIAERYHVDYKLLAAYNNITNPNKIYPGQIIRVKGGKKVANFFVIDGNTGQG